MRSVGRVCLVIILCDPVVVVAPVGLHEGGVDVLCGDGGFGGADSLDEAGCGEVDGVA